MACQIIPFPQELRPQLPTIVGNVDYLTLRQRLEQIDALLRDSGAERDFVQRALAGWTRAGSGKPTALEQGKFQQRSRRALRCTILRTLLQENYRGFSCQLAGNPLYQWFCLVDALDQVRVPSKSEVQRFAHWLPAGQMRAVIEGLLKVWTSGSFCNKPVSRCRPRSLKKDCSICAACGSVKVSKLWMGSLLIPGWVWVGSDTKCGACSSRGLTSRRGGLMTPC
jgi:hypothetical protein